MSINCKILKLSAAFYICGNPEKSMKQVGEMDRFVLLLNDRLIVIQK